MARILSLLFILPSLIFAQEITPPEISLDSGLYEEAIEVTISHSDPNITILYTLDGSEPSFNNLNGKVWSYKTFYPIAPGDDFGELYQSKLWTYVYSNPIVMENKTPEETILAEISYTIIENNFRPQGELFKANILRVRAYSKTTEEYSETISRNYFIESEINNRYTIPIIAISIDNDKFYGYEDGINVPGILFDEWRIENPDAPFNGFAPANYQKRGGETELTIHFNYFENGNEILNHNAGLRMNGGYTRVYPNKSLRLYAKSKYGAKSFHHNFFNNYRLNKFERLILRNSGNDAAASFFRDALSHKVAKNLNFDIQESQPVAVFINGEYNGLRNIRERYDSKYFKSIHDIPEGALDFLENYVDAKEGDTVFYEQMMDFFSNNTLEEDSKFEEGVTYLDPINFTDFYITNIYAANDDWPGNNFLFYRYKTDYNPNSEDSGVKDGRFRWLLKDLDRGFHLGNRFENGYEGNTLEWATQDNHSTLIIRRLLDNSDYKQYFINRFADLLNTTFKEERMLLFIEESEDLYRPEIEENGRRWDGFTAKPFNWQADVNRMKTFATNRPKFQREHIIDKFDLDGIFDLVLNVSNEEHGFIHLNTIDIHPSTDGIESSVYPWIGEYFLNVPITLKAIAEEGFVFSHWSGASNTTDEEIKLTLNDDSYLKAHFIPKSMGVEDKDKHEIVLYPNPTSDKIYIKTQSELKNYVIYDIQGKMIKSGSISNNTIDLHELDSAMYLIQLELKDGFKNQLRVIKK